MGRLTGNIARHLRTNRCLGRCCRAGLFLAIALLLLPGCERADNSYALETVVSFARGGRAELYRGEGWSSTDDAFTWTDGSRATLNLILAPGRGALGLRMRLSGMIKPPALPWQPVAVYANGAHLADWLVWEKADFVAVIRPKFLKRSGQLELELRFSNATSPASVGDSGDARMLGVRCYEMEISKAPNTTEFQPKPGMHATVDG